MRNSRNKQGSTKLRSFCTAKQSTAQMKDKLPSDIVCLTFDRGFKSNTHGAHKSQWQSEKQWTSKQAENPNSYFSKEWNMQVWTIAWYKAQDLRLGRFKPTASQPGKRFQPQGSREMMQKERCVCTARRETNWDKYVTIPQKLMEFPYDLMCPFLRTCFTECHWSLK